jgi:hypothetical protein
LIAAAPAAPPSSSLAVRTSIVPARLLSNSMRV